MFQKAHCRPSNTVSSKMHMYYARNCAYHGEQETHCETCSVIGCAAVPGLHLEATRTCADNRPLKLLKRYVMVCSTGAGLSAHTSRCHSCHTQARAQQTDNRALMACHDVFRGGLCPSRFAFPAKKVHNRRSAQQTSRHSITHVASTAKH